MGFESSRRDFGNLFRWSVVKYSRPEHHIVKILKSIEFDS
jgi:hypothetical protein